MKIFENYKRIGIDFDETLIDHRNSALLWDYIQENPYGQEFHIITFRSGGMEKRVWGDLTKNGSRLTETHFTKLHACPHELWLDFHYGNGLILPPHPYLDWKATVCADHGIEVLIDDMACMVEEGCKKFGIRYIHPDSLGS